MVMIYVAIIVSVVAVMVYVFIGIVLCAAGRSIGLFAFAFLMTPKEFEKVKNSVEKEGLAPLKCVIRAPADEILSAIRRQYHKIKRVV